jgi:predicted MFS family arabinose efflux permease
MASTAAATTAGVLPLFLVGSQAVQLRAEFGFDLAAIGGLVAFGWVAASAASTPMGRLAEQAGGGRALRTAALINAVAMLLIAAVGRSWAVLVVLVVFGGLGNAMAQPAANILTARTIPLDRQGIAFGIKQSAIPLATLLGGLAVPVITLSVGWRWSYVAGAAFAGLAALLVVHEGPRAAADDPTEPGVGLVEAIEDAAAGPAGADHPVSEVLLEEPVAAWEPGRVARRRRPPLIVLAMGVGLGASAAGALSQFLVSGGVAAGLAEGTAGLLLSLGSAVGIGSRLFVGARADRRPGDQLATVVAMMVLGSVAYAALGLGVPVAYVLATPIAFGLGWAWPGLFNLSVVREYPEAPGAATGITQTGTYLGAGLGPLLIGVVVDRWSFAVAWPASAALLVGGAVLMLVGRRAVRASASA